MRKIQFRSLFKGCNVAKHFLIKLVLRLILGDDFK